MVYILESLRLQSMCVRGRYWLTDLLSSASLHKSKTVLRRLTDACIEQIIGTYETLQEAREFCGNLGQK
jgi:hypothetical protein